MHTPQTTHTTHTAQPCTSRLADKLEQAEAMASALLSIALQPSFDIGTVRGVLYALHDTLAEAAGTANAIKDGQALVSVV